MLARHNCLKQSLALVEYNAVGSPRQEKAMEMLEKEYSRHNFGKSNKLALKIINATFMRRGSLM